VAGEGNAWTARDLLLAFLFAAISLVLGMIEFHVPGVEGASVDLREVGLLIGVFHLRHWSLTLVPAALTSLATPAEGSLAGTLVMHVVGAPLAWFVHRALVRRLDSGLALAAGWAGFVAAWYLLLVIPLLAVTHWLFGMIAAEQIVPTYLSTVRVVPYELATTAATTALYLANRQEQGRRRRLEVQLRQAQKMDALGHLAGGMAHDFNNMLAVMTLNLGLLRAQLAAGKPTGDSVAAIHADPTMVEQVAMNLVINARDAMHETGERRIVISARPVGQAVELAVRDTGVGMDPATSTRIFEPFFTTKAEGKGTGLGLATVYGIVRQHGAAIDVASQPGAGTTIRITWPAAPAS
jgi:signal transduction histidine kinase